MLSRPAIDQYGAFSTRHTTGPQNARVVAQRSECSEDPKADPRPPARPVTSANALPVPCPEPWMGMLSQPGYATEPTARSNPCRGMGVPARPAIDQYAAFSTRHTTGPQNVRVVAQRSECSEDPKADARPPARPRKTCKRSSCAMPRALESAGWACCPRVDCVTRASVLSGPLPNKKDEHDLKSSPSFNPCIPVNDDDRLSHSLLIFHLKKYQTYVPNIRGILELKTGNNARATSTASTSNTA